VAELEQIRPLAQKAAIHLEKIHSLETQLSLMEDLRKRATDMEIEITLLKKEKEAWNTFLESNEGNQRPEEISKELSRERIAHKADEERLQMQETELDELRKRIKTLEGSIDNLNSEVQGKQDKLTKLERRYERLDRQRSLAQREVGFLKEQLKTYDSEETVFMSGAAVDAQKAARIEGLEKMVEELKSELDRVSKEGPLPGPSIDNNKRKRSEVREEDEETRRKVRILQNGISDNGFTNSRSNEVTSIRNTTTERDKFIKIASRVS
jgi:mitotic spindle assembly checkpoint protein MAD1